MFQYQKLPADVIKYLIVGGIILGIIVIIPNNKLGVKDSLILSIILTLVIAIFEHATMLITQSNADATKEEKFDVVTSSSTISSDSTASATTAVSTTQNVQDVPIQPEETSIMMKTDEIEKQTPDVPITPTQITVNSEESGNMPVINTVTKEEIKAGVPNADKKEASGSRAEDDVIISDMPFTDYHHLPLGDTYKPSDFEYGYSFLPPEKWYPTPPFPPVCVSEKRCPVCPVYTTGTPVDVKEWKEASKILPPDGINIDYIKKLNAGR